MFQIECRIVIFLSQKHTNRLRIFICRRRNGRVDTFMIRKCGGGAGDGGGRSDVGV